MDYTELITQFPNLIVKENEPLSNYSHTKTGGPADLLFFPASVEETTAVINWTRSEGYPLTILGNASNLIVRDGGIRGVTVILTELSNITVEKNRMVVESGAPIIEVSQNAYEHELTGLEFACGIPGSVGGALYMNAGAYGGEIKDVLVSTVVVDQQGELRTLTAAELDLSYRTSNIPTHGYIVLEATFAL